MFKLPLLLTCRFSVMAAVLVTYPALTVNAQSQTSGRAVASNEIKFTQIAPFVKMGSAWGDRATDKHGTFGEFPGKASSPPHTHSGAYHAVVISGVMINPFEGETNPKKLGPGSYWYVPAGMEHVTACVSEDPCSFYFHAEGAFDFTPIGQ